MSTFSIGPAGCAVSVHTDLVGIGHMSTIAVQMTRSRLAVAADSAQLRVSDDGRVAIEPGDKFRASELTVAASAGVRDFQDVDPLRAWDVMLAVDLLLQREVTTTSQAVAGLHEMLDERLRHSGAAVRAAVAAAGLPEDQPFFHALWIDVAARDWTLLQGSQSGIAVTRSGRVHDGDRFGVVLGHAEPPGHGGRALRHDASTETLRKDCVRSVMQAARTAPLQHGHATVALPARWVEIDGNGIRRGSVS